MVDDPYHIYEYQYEHYDYNYQFDSYIPLQYQAFNSKTKPKKLEKQKKQSTHTRDGNKKS